MLTFLDAKVRFEFRYLEQPNFLRTARNFSNVSLKNFDDIFLLQKNTTDLDEIARKFGESLDNHGIRVQISITHGSILARIRLTALSLTSLFAVGWGGVTTFPNFQEGIEKICDLDRIYFSCVVDSFINSTGMINGPVEDVEFTTGSLEDILKARGMLVSSAQRWSGSELRLEVDTNRVSSHIFSILSKINDSKTRKNVFDLIFDDIEAGSHWAFISRTRNSVMINLENFDQIYENDNIFLENFESLEKYDIRNFTCYEKYGAHNYNFAGEIGIYPSQRKFDLHE